MAASSRLVEWCESLHPAIDRGGVNLNGTFRQPLGDLDIREPEGKIPTHGQADDVVGKPMSTEG